MFSHTIQIRFSCSENVIKLWSKSIYWQYKLSDIAFFFFSNNAYNIVAAYRGGKRNTETDTQKVENHIFLHFSFYTLLKMILFLQYYILK